MWYVGEEDSGAAIESEVHCGRLSNEVKHEQITKIQNDDFKTKAKDPTIGLALFGTVPPPKKLLMTQVNSIASCVAESIKSIQADGVLVYDIQDDTSRNGEERPFPFFQTHEPRLYAQLLEKYASNCNPIIYHAMIPGQTANEFKEWANETAREFGAKNIVLVGGKCLSGETILSVIEASKQIMERRSQDIFLGGIVIPERHRDAGNEHERLLEKTANGIGFYTSQVVYNADNAIWLLRDYDQLCKHQNKDPARLVFTFAPFGSDNTVQFMKWLGVELPEGTVKRVLSRRDLKGRVEESIEICWENWKRILDASKRLKISVPIGFSVESVSKSKTEQDAAVQLFKILKEEMDFYYTSKQLKHSGKMI